MGRIWSDENKFRMWLAVELAATETLAEAGMVPGTAARNIVQTADIDVKRMAAIEAEAKHDVMAFTTAVAEKIDDTEASPWLHHGLPAKEGGGQAQARQNHA